MTTMLRVYTHIYTDDLFVKCMRQVTKGHLYHLLGILDYYVMMGRGPSQFCETSAKVTDWVCELLLKVCG